LTLFQFDFKRRRLIHLQNTKIHGSGEARPKLNFFAQIEKWCYHICDFATKKIRVTRYASATRLIHSQNSFKHVPQV
jgi:hypothetical protein